MSQIYYRYVDAESDRDIRLNNVNFTIKLIVINSDYSTEGSVVDSSEIFFDKTLSSGGQKSGEVDFPFEEKKEGSLSIVLDLDKEMNISNNFKRFWAKWSSKCGESGWGSPPTSTFYFGLQVSQTFRGDANFAGFSRTDNLFVPAFHNKGENCTPRKCEVVNFNFWNIDASRITVNRLLFDKQLITTKQIKAAEAKIAFEVQLANFQAQLIAQSPELILSNYDYQPNSFTKVITRLLEFQQGTLVTSLDFARNADLTQLFALLGPVNGLENEINSLAGLYPDITIEDGEGIPYGDGIPALYEYFGWNFNGRDDLFAVVNKDASSVSNYGIITRNNVEIMDTRDYFSLSNVELFIPSEYIPWGNNAGFEKDDIIECTITLTDFTEDDTNFTKSNFGFELDSVSSGLTITRGLEDGIYNSLVESEWDSNISPSGTTWNSELNAGGGNFGWSNLSSVSSRTFGTFYQALGEDISKNIVGLELVMYDETTDEYWTVKFTQWSSIVRGAGFEYTRRLIVPSGNLKTFKDTLIWKG